MSVAPRDLLPTGVARKRKVSTIVDWDTFARAVVKEWRSPTEFQRAVGLSAGTLARFWYSGGSIPLGPFIVACDLMDIPPLDFVIVERK
jgi:hypothetical protein